MTTAQDRKHLGVGWAFPVRPSGGRLGYARYEEDVEQAIGIILETAREERVMMPGFGAGLRGYVFDANSPATHRSLEGEVQRALAEWEPRITVEAVRATPDPNRGNVLLIEIDYVVRRTNAFFNLVYPFYLTEGV
jgi:hypothetical protein